MFNLRLSYLFLLFLLALPQTSLAETTSYKLEDIAPLKEGAKLPDAEIRSATGKATSLSTLNKDQALVLIFYRGGWCPYCNQHLGSLKGIEGELKKLGYKLIALSPDRPEKLQESSKRQDLSYALYSDSKMNAAKAFGLAFMLDDETVKRYKEQYKIDVEADSGETHHLLPVPAAYVIDATGTVVFAYHDKDYKSRIDSKLLLKKAEQARD